MSLSTSETKTRQAKMGKVISDQQRETLKDTGQALKLRNLLRHTLQLVQSSDRLEDYVKDCPATMRPE